MLVNDSMPFQEQRLPVLRVQQCDAKLGSLTSVSVLEIVKPLLLDFSSVHSPSNLRYLACLPNLLGLLVIEFYLLLFWSAPALLLIIKSLMECESAAAGAFPMTTCYS